MNVKSFVLGPLDNNAYVVHNSDNSCVVIDAPSDIETLLDYVNEKKLKVEAILLTHSHFDHIGGLDLLTQKTSAPVYIHKSEEHYLTDPELNGSTFFSVPFKTKPADNVFEHGTILNIAGMEIKIIHTPGHTPGGSCFLIGDNLFSGDTLFRFSIGRTDLPGSSTKDIIDSINKKLFTLPKETSVWPGHGRGTNMGQEKRLNPFTKQKVD